MCDPAISLLIKARRNNSYSLASPVRRTQRLFDTEQKTDITGIIDAKEGYL